MGLQATAQIKDINRYYYQPPRTEKDREERRAGQRVPKAGGIKHVKVKWLKKILNGIYKRKSINQPASSLL